VNWVMGREVGAMARGGFVMVNGLTVLTVFAYAFNAFALSDDLLLINPLSQLFAVTASLFLHLLCLLLGSVYWRLATSIRPDLLAAVHRSSVLIIGIQLGMYYVGRIGREELTRHTVYSSLIFTIPLLYFVFLSFLLNHSTYLTYIQALLHLLAKIFSISLILLTPFLIS